MSEPRPPQPAADRNLLFGVLALQLDFVGRDAVIEGMNAWALDKARSLGQILCERGALSAARRALLDSLVEEHVQQHGGDARKSLESVTSRSTVADGLPVGDPDGQSTVSELDPRARSTTFQVAPARNGSRYRRLRPHARGGLGEVFVAEDTELHREVAVKEIQPGRAFDESSRSRFVLEAEVTGALEHPGIVPVYGLGCYADGRPYYAMRFVRGDNLKAAIDRFHAAEKSGRPPAERALAFRALLRRFIDVCNAVAYAHSRRVIHRDLKPQNVMLGKFGETLVLDWGLAKVGVDRGAPDPARDLTTDPSVRPASGSDHDGTRAGAVLGTPGYMSPEQAAGRIDEVGPASDVYSLGATLYCLLTGKKPFDRTDSTIPTGDRPEDLVPPRRLNPEVPAALDAACRKAMAVRPADRYASALDLAADMERWLADEPVAVYRDPWPVRAARWARRHQTPVIAGLVFLVSAVVALSVGTALVWQEQRRTLAQKREAEANYELVRDLSGGIELVAANEAVLAADPAKHKSRKELLVASARAYHKHVRLQPDDPEVQRQAARVYRYTANVHRLERDYAAAEPLYRDALDLLEALTARVPEDPAYQLQLSETLRDWATVQGRLGRLAEAVRSLDRVIALADAVIAATGNEPWARRARAAGLLARSTVQYTRGRFDEAGADAKQAADLFEALSAARPGAHPYDPLLRAAAVNALALVERDSGRPEKAAELHRQVIPVADPLVKEPKVGVNKADAEHFQMAFRLEQARTWARIGRPADAEKNFGLLAGRWLKLADAHPEVGDYREWPGVAYEERGRVRESAGRPAEARADFEEARRLLQAEVDRSPDVPEISADLGRAHAGLARLARAAGDRSAAADSFQKAVAALQSCVDRAPDRARDRQDLEAVRADAAR